MTEEKKGQQPRSEPERASQTQELPATPAERPKPPARAPKWVCELEIGAVSELGRVRDINEDNFLFVNPRANSLLARRGSLYAVADGMGGHASGQVASELALRTCFDHYYRDPEASTPEAAMLHAYGEANAIVHSTGRGVSGREGMGTTLACVAIMGNRVLIGNVGDSRVYMIHGQNVAQLTKDHSLVAEQVRQGILTAEEAMASPFRNVITRCIGNEPNVEPDLLWQEIQPGDVLLLCSDGLSNLVEPQEMAAALADADASEAARSLVNLASARGAPDNVTVLIVRIKNVVRTTRSALARWRMWAASVGAAIVGALLMLAALWAPLHGRPSETQLAAALAKAAQNPDLTAALEPKARDLILQRLKSASGEPWTDQQAAMHDARLIVRALEALETRVASNPVTQPLLARELEQEARTRLEAAYALLNGLPKRNPDALP